MKATEKVRFQKRINQPKKVAQIWNPLWFQMV